MENMRKYYFYLVKKQVPWILGYSYKKVKNYICTKRSVMSITNSDMDKNTGYKY